MKRTITRYECDGPDCATHSEKDDAETRWIYSGVAGHSVYIYLLGQHESVRIEAEKWFCCPTCYGAYVAERVMERMRELAATAEDEAA